MQRLSGLDASFLYLETPSAPMHVGGLMVLDPSTRPDGFSIDAVHGMYEERLHLAKPFRRRIRHVPFGLHHPVWFEDPEFNLHYPVRHIAVPRPGGARELAQVAAELFARPLDLTRPLWEAWVIEGLEHGHYAVLTKVHHAAIDGVAGNELTLAMLDVEPHGRQLEPPTAPWQPDPVPSETEMLAYAAGSLARQPARLARNLARTATTLVRSRQAAREPTLLEGEAPPSPFSAPRASWNQAITGRRSYAMASLPIEDVKHVRRVFGTTLNDVVMAMCAGSLRRYLDARGEAVEGNLVAMVPMSVRPDDAKGRGGNHVTSMLASLYTTIDDPVERLRAVSSGMQRAKAQQNAIGATTLQDWAEFAAPAVFGRAVRAYSRLHLANRHRPIFNLTISNVPGPNFPLYSAGSRMVANYPLGPINDGAGLNMTVLSYLHQLDFGVVTDSHLINDAWDLVDGLGEALAELAKAAEANS